MSEDIRHQIGQVVATKAPVKPYESPIPQKNSIYKYRLVLEGTGRWEGWFDSLDEIPPIPKDSAYNEIIVPTIDTVRYMYLMKLLLTHQKAALFVGPTGTGKSTYVTVNCSNSENTSVSTPSPVTCYNNS